jgi:deazaflavin-dependent oxidoreductase (nitroreductase family)
MSATLAEFRAPTAPERLFNQVFGFVVGMGLGRSYHYVLEVRGRKTGKIYSTPVSLLEMNGKKFLVAPRGRTQWVRNAEATGEITLKKGSSQQRFGLRALSNADRPPILKEYLDRYRSEVQRYFPVAAGSPAEAFEEVAGSYPVFELRLV